MDQFSVDFTSFTPRGRANLITDNGLDNREPAARLGTTFDICSIDFIYWQNRIEGVADRLTEGRGGQFRSVGLESEAGLRVLPQLDVFYYHHSQHVLDQATSYGYPVEDGFGLRLNVIERKR